MLSKFQVTKVFFFDAYFSSNLRNSGEKSKKTQKMAEVAELWAKNISAHRVSPDIRFAAADVVYSIVSVFHSFRKS